MKTKSFDAYAQQRLTKKEISSIKKQAKIEKELFDTWQETIVQTIHKHMEQKNIGFNELAKQLDISPTQMSKILKGQANLTLLSMASIFSSMNLLPQLTFKKK